MIRFMFPLCLLLYGLALNLRLPTFQGKTHVWWGLKVIWYKGCSVAKSCLTLCDPVGCTMPGFLVLHYLLEFAQTHGHWVTDATQPSHPLLPPSSPALSLSQHWVFSNKSALCIRWPKYQSFSFSISPSKEYSGFISFRMDWLDLLVVQGTLKSLLQHHSLKTSILQHSAFFFFFFFGSILPSIHDYWKNHSFNYTDLVSKVMSLLFNMLSRFVITEEGNGKPL